MAFDRTKMAALFPEFGDENVYPDVALEAWREQAYATLLESRWGNRLDFGAMLFVAHNLVLARRASANPGSSGQIEGVKTAKSVGPLSVSYDVASVTNAGASYWNTTSYGVQFWQILKGIGAGGLYIPAEPGVPWTG